MRACFLFVVLLLLAACTAAGEMPSLSGTETPPDEATESPPPPLTATPATPSATATPEPEPTASPAPPEEPTATVEIAPTPIDEESEGGEVLTTPNGRLFRESTEEVYLDADAAPESLVRREWADPDFDAWWTLEVEILDDDGASLFRHATWEEFEPSVSPGEVDPEEASLFFYNVIESVEARDLTGDGIPEVALSTRHPGTGQVLDVAIVQVSGEVATIFEVTGYKGSLTLADDGFTMQEPLYLFGEANCCPCRMQQVRYAWNGEEFAAVERVREALDPEDPQCPAYPQPASWERIEVANGPPPRRDAVLAHDPVRQRLILFGGRSGGVPLGDTWIFDLESAQWERVETPVAPPARFSMVAGVDPFGARVLITTGQAGPDEFFNDVWAFDLESNSWSEVATTGEPPAPRYGSAGGIFAYGDTLYLSHGFTNAGRFDDTWALDLESNSWSNVTPEGEVPLKRCLHSAAMSAPGQFVLFGGCSSGFGPCPQGDSWQYRGGDWKALAAETAPSPRQFSAMASFADRSELLLFGGSSEQDVNLGDTWMLDVLLGEWREVPTGGVRPSPRQGHSMSDGWGPIYLFGGEGDDGELNDLWLFSPGDE